MATNEKTELIMFTMKNNSTLCQVSEFELVPVSFSLRYLSETWG